MVSLGGFYLLKQHKEFQYVYNKGKNAHANSVVLFSIKKPTFKKVGFTATKKIGNAVIRNRAKRRLRALFVKHSPQLEDGFYVFVAKSSTVEVSAKQLEKDFLKVLSRLKMRIEKRDA